MTRTIDPAYLLSRVESLEGQARLFRAMLVATIAGIEDKAKCAQTMALIWSDLQIHMKQTPQTSKEDFLAKQNTWNGANSSWNDLQSALAEYLQSGKPK